MRSQEGGEKKHYASNSVAPPPEVLCKQLFRDNPNESGGRLGMLPLFEGMEVELVEKLSHHSNILKGVKGKVQRIILDASEDMTWADPRSNEAQIGRVVLRHFPKLVLRLNDEHEAKGALASDTNVVVVGPTVQKDRGRTKVFTARWSVGGGGGRAAQETSSIQSLQIPVLPTAAITTGAAQGTTAEKASFFPQPLAQDSLQRIQEDWYTALSRVRHVLGLLLRMDPKTALKLKEALEMGPAAHVRAELYRLDCRWGYTLSVVDVACKCMGWARPGEELAAWRRPRAEALGGGAMSSLRAFIVWID